MVEADIERYLKRRVEAAGGRTFKVKFLSTRGAPDRMILLPGFGAFVELKRTSTLKLTALQNHIRGMLLHAGLRCYALGSREQVDNLLELAIAQGKKTIAPVPKTCNRLSKKD